MCVRVRRFATMRWGLLPSWAEDMSIGYMTINARAETVATTPSFRESSKSQRCLVPADGFYEWVRHEALLSDIHDRMPVILSPDNYDLWLYATKSLATKHLYARLCPEN
jgi:putative SOS response-associated peptidase YedK